MCAESKNPASKKSQTGNTPQATVHLEPLWDGVQHLCDAETQRKVVRRQICWTTLVIQLWFRPDGYFFFPGMSAFIRDSQVDAESIGGAVGPCFFAGAGDVACVSPPGLASGGSAVAAPGPEFAGVSATAVFG